MSIASDTIERETALSRTASRSLPHRLAIRAATFSGVVVFSGSVLSGAASADVVSADAPVAASMKSTALTDESGEELGLTFYTGNMAELISCKTRKFAWCY